MTNDAVNIKIRTTFIELLNKKPYRRITFKELATEAGMSRQNLYYYYKSKESVLEDIIEEFFDNLYEAMFKFDFQEIGSDNEELGRAFIRTIIQALKDHEEIAKCFFSKDVNIVFINKMVAFLTRILGSLIRAQGITVNDPKYIHYLALQMAGASYLPIREWLLVDTSFPQERIVELAYPMVQQIIDSLKKN
jgi:AcrR family transcriptional regulator